jgi:MFS family permease
MIRNGGRFGGDFWLYLVSRFCAGTALTLLRATIAWHVFDLTRSPFHLGLIGLVQFAPALLLSLVGGAVADSYERRRIVMTAQSVPLLSGLAMLMATHAELINVSVLYAVVFGVAVAASFDNPARASLLPNLVSRDLFPRAVTVASTTQALAFASGPTLAGLIIAELGIGVAYGTTSLLLLIGITTLSRVRPSWPEGKQREVSVAAIREGLRFVWGHPVILGCMTLDMFAVIFGGATALLPVYANEILAVGARGYGILAASLEAGALLMSLVLMTRAPIRRSGRALLITVMVYGVATIVFGASRWFPLSLVAYMLVGMADQVSVVLRSTIIQLNTPDALRGRVSSVNFIFIGASNQLGAVESGFVAALTSAPFAVISGGLGCLLVVALVAVRMPQLRQYKLQAA